LKIEAVITGQLGPLCAFLANMVVDTKYYETLGLDPSCSDTEIKKVSTFKAKMYRWTETKLFSFRLIENLCVTVPIL
jgi:hypothetical protein